MAATAPPSPHALHVAAFTTGAPWTGNPAGVVLLPPSDRAAAPAADDTTSWLSRYPPAAWMQALAAEFNLSETAFVLPAGAPGRFWLRWFTPTTEVDLCGHATLAAAAAVFDRGFGGAGAATPRLSFHSRSGPLLVERVSPQLLQMDFPSTPPVAVGDAAEATAILRHLEAGLRLPGGTLVVTPAGSPHADHVVYVGRSAWDVVVHVARSAVFDALPRGPADMDLAALARIHCRGVIVTADGGADGGGDGAESPAFVSRFLGPNCGVPEDPVTGSAHCALAPYWTARLPQRAAARDGWLHGFQASARGGDVWVKLQAAADGSGSGDGGGARVLLRGRAGVVTAGTLAVPVPPPEDAAPA